MAWDPLLLAPLALSGLALLGASVYAVRSRKVATRLRTDLQAKGLYGNRLQHVVAQQSGELERMHNELRAMREKLDRSSWLAEANKGQWRAFAEHAPGLILIVDRDGMILFTNRHAPGAHLGVGANLTRLAPPDRAAILRERVGRVHLRAVSVSVELTFDPAVVAAEVQGAVPAPAFAFGAEAPRAVSATNEDLAPGAGNGDAPPAGRQAGADKASAATPAGTKAGDKEPAASLGRGRHEEPGDARDGSGADGAGLVAPDGLEQADQAEATEDTDAADDRAEEGPRTYLVQMSPLVRDGKVAAAVVIVTDATDMRRGLEARKEADERGREVTRLEGLSVFKTRLLDTTAHELSNPLQAIQLQFAMLRMGGTEGMTDRQRRALEVMRRNLRRLQLLVQDMRDLTRIQSGKLYLAPSPHDMRTLVTEVVDAYRDIARAAGVELEAELPHMVPAVVDGDRMAQVLHNLVGNAVKFTPAGGLVVVETHTGPGEAVVRVRDTGRGLAPEAVPRLFEAFSQVHVPHGGSERGTGLGLYICKNLVDAHGGRIEVHSDGPDEGTTFTVVLPVEEAVQRAVLKGDAPVAKGSVAPSLAPGSEEEAAATGDGRPPVRQRDAPRGSPPPAPPTAPVPGARARPDDATAPSPTAGLRPDARPADAREADSAPADAVPSDAQPTDPAPIDVVTLDAQDADPTSADAGPREADEPARRDAGARRNGKMAEGGAAMEETVDEEPVEDEAQKEEPVEDEAQKEEPVEDEEPEVFLPTHEA